MAKLADEQSEVSIAFPRFSEPPRAIQLARGLVKTAPEAKQMWDAARRATVKAQGRSSAFRKADAYHLLPRQCMAPRECR
jgi:hypothetical protein